MPKTTEEALESVIEPYATLAVPLAKSARGGRLSCIMSKPDNPIFPSI